MTKVSKGRVASSHQRLRGACGPYQRGSRALPKLAKGARGPKTGSRGAHLHGSVGAILRDYDVVEQPRPAVRARAHPRPRVVEAGQALEEGRERPTLPRRRARAVSAPVHAVARSTRLGLAAGVRCASERARCKGTAVYFSSQQETRTVGTCRDTMRGSKPKPGRTRVCSSGPVEQEYR